MQVKVKIPTVVNVVAVKVSAEARYWEDASVNGEEDTDGTKIPFRRGDLWEPVIDLDTGRIRDWPQGTTADVHYKVCDAGVYELINAEGRIVARKDGYVPYFLAPGGGGYGDYIILTIDAEGKIPDWRAPGFGDHDPDDESEWTWLTDEKGE